MATTARPEVSKSDKPSKARSKKPVQQPEGKLKVVVRRLPPNLPEPVFWNSVLLWVNEETSTWKQFCPGKLRKGLNKENVPSRAYIAFKTLEQLTLFSKEYDGHIFRDKSGNESEAVVEYAPFQKVPADKKKPDLRAGTILEDEDYLSFITSLSQTEPTEAEKAAAVPPPVADEKTTTPLLAALLAEKTAAKDKESIIRNHSHYHTDDGPPSRKRQDHRYKEKVQEAIEFSRSLNPHAAEPSTRAAAKDKPSHAKSSAQAKSGSIAEFAEDNEPNKPAVPRRTKQKQRSKEKEKAKDVDKDQRLGDPLEIGEGTSRPRSSTTKASAPRPPKIAVRPHQRVDDEGVDVPPPPTAGIIPVQITPTNRGRGGRGGRGRGRGRGGPQQTAQE
ncbi:hypothetical protein FRB99_002703 [Tulasnella sp. 403]|nr:hypothetical protein FRB99_002703 [Tulasnella sp. 403]